MAFRDSFCSFKMAAFCCSKMMKARAVAGPLFDFSTVSILENGAKLMGNG
jgi:hypothetical protein